MPDPKTMNAAANTNLRPVLFLDPTAPKAQSNWDTLEVASDRVGHYGVKSAGNSGDYIDFDLTGIKPGSYQLVGLIHAAATSGIDFKVNGVKVTDLAAATLDTIADDANFGDGSDGAITRSSNATESALLQCTTYQINSGVTMTAPGNGCIIMATESITINGTLDADALGSAGGDGGDSSNPGSARDGKPGAAGSGTGGAGGSNTTGSPGGAGGSERYAGVTDEVIGLYTGHALYGAGGGGGGVPVNSSNVGRGGGGGASLFASGGAGGGTTGTASGFSDGGDGAAGGGFIILIAPTITLGASAVLTAKGGDGANGPDTSNGGGGGGAGGHISLLYNELSDSGATITVDGGTGGDGGGGASGGAGGSEGNDGAAGAAGSSGQGGAGGGGAGGMIIMDSVANRITSKRFTTATFQVNNYNPGDLRIETTVAAERSVGLMQLVKV